MSTYLLVDTSYTIFYRFFATRIWYNLAHPEDKFDSDYDWFQNEVFLNKFVANYIAGIDKIAKKFYIRNGKIIFACDCARKNIWRRQHFPDYKRNRDGKYGTQSNQVNIGPFFRHVNTVVLPLLQEKYSCFRLTEQCLEADDVIAVVKEFLTGKNPNNKYVIVTSDHDLNQLKDDSTEIIDMKQRPLRSFGKPAVDLQMKILCGDKSDNIPGCFKRCGKKTALKLIGSSELLRRQFEKEPGSEAQYQLNTLLIDLRHIPLNPKKELCDYLETILR